MLPYATLHDAETALNRSLTAAETLWFNYSADKSDYFLYCHNILFLFLVFSVFPLSYLLLEFLSRNVRAYKIQPKVNLSYSETFKCYGDVMRMFILVVGPLQLVSYPSVQLIGVRTSLPLPSIWEVVAQLAVYFMVEDFGNYWIHRFLHCKWGYEKIHKVHHEYTAPIGFAAPYAHWAEVLILGIPSFCGPAIAPGHMITFWLWIGLRQIEAIETHSGYAHAFLKLPFYLRQLDVYGVVLPITFDESSFKLQYDFPWSPTKYIPFYGGADYHDYHHYVGGQSQSNFASVFTYCDYIYGTDKGYRYQKKLLRQVTLELLIFLLIADL
ncbi:hypothetical protein RJ640_027244 [Escallonia rubra]|uniref:Fatty acid hydroxylase domain-containing protein n=1 Tax=Escallonia rubra TaxID=112253 RepID=A0AA88UCH1_9ASTE|nr:hypothetical protein RJ640_027244 [Escallonia rubra]